MTNQEVLLAPATETETLRQQLLQAQRLSSVGSKIEPACDTLSLAIRIPAFQD